jgi:hypothetical protein
MSRELSMVLARAAVRGAVGRILRGQETFNVEGQSLAGRAEFRQADVGLARVQVRRDVGVGAQDGRVL